MADETELLDALMVAATGYARAGNGGDGPVDGWPAFLSLLARTIQAESLSLQLIPAEGTGHLWQHGPVVRLPDPADVARMRLDRVYAQVDLPGTAPPCPLRALRSALPGGGHLLLWAASSGADFRAIDTVRISGLARGLARALASWQALRTERARAALDRCGAQSLGLGWLVLSPAGRVLALADPALLAPAGLRLRADGWLDIPDSETAAALQAALVQAQVQDHVVPVATRDPALHLSVGRCSHAGGPALLLWLRWRRPLGDLPPDVVARTFRLSRSEARLAARIADGQTLAEAAAVLGWTVETARSCSKQLFARMGVGGQIGVALALQTPPWWQNPPATV